MKSRQEFDYSHFKNIRVGGDQTVDGNGIDLASAAASAAPTVGAVGDDANVSLKLVPKGTAQVIATTNVLPVMTATTDATAGPLTYTAAMLLGGLILRDPAGAARSDVTPTAALLAAAIPGVIAGTAFRFTIRNTADAAETITVTAGTGATLSGTMTIAQNNSKDFLVVFTSASAYTVYSVGTFVH